MYRTTALALFLKKDMVEFYTVSYSQDSRIDDIDLFSEY